MSAPHLIRRLRVELRTAKADEAFRLRQRVAEGLQSAAFGRALETLLDRFGSAETTWQIDRLEVPLGEFSAETFEASWMPRLLGVLEQSLAERSANPREGFKPSRGDAPLTRRGTDSRGYTPTSEVTLETFAEVLRTGQWPRWAAPLAWSAWEKTLKTALRQHPARAAVLLAPVLAQPEAARRLVWQFQKSTVETLLRHLVGDDLLTRWQRKEASSQTAGREAGIGEKKVREKLQTARMAFVAALAKRGWVPDEAVFREIERIFFTNPTLAPTQQSPGPVRPDFIPNEARHDDPAPVQPLAVNAIFKPEPRPSRFIGLAGLVLLHPFLASFFEELGFTEKTDFRLEAARQRAVHVLAHLAGHASNPPEVALVLPKILVGLSPETPLRRRIRLSTREKAEARHLLLAVLGHWEALRNTSPEALQTEFLQREGRLDQRDDGWHLTVESRPADVLLGRLPWGLSLVKLPWMTEWLHVNWA